MLKLRWIALTSFIVCHLLLIDVFFKKSILDTYPSVFPLFWLLGVINALTTIFYADSIKVKKWVLVMMAIGSIAWLLLPIAFATISHPLFLAFFISGLYVHTKSI